LITATLEGTLPDVESLNLEDIMPIISQEMLRSVQLNFGQGGRPAKWQPLKSGNPSYLFKTGILLRSIQRSSGPNWAEVATAGLPYARIHQVGGMAGRGHRARIPARNYMMFQPEDIEYIKKALVKHIITFLEAARRPINA
jgi:phage virion morphogenesis protein